MQLIPIIKAFTDVSNNIIQKYLRRNNVRVSKSVANCRVVATDRLEKGEVLNNKQRSCTNIPDVYRSTGVSNNA